MSISVAIVDWYREVDGLPQVIQEELTGLGYDATLFYHREPVPTGVDIVFTWAPYGPLLPIFEQLATIPIAKRPIIAHWNTEGLPDLRIPWPFMQRLSSWRTELGRLVEYGHSAMGRRLAWPLSRLLANRVLRFRYLGDYYHAKRHNWLDVFADSSSIYAQLHAQHGLPTIVAPWGSTRLWHDDLRLERDIDVLWMGSKQQRRRQKIVGNTVKALRDVGLNVYVADNQEQPFLFGAERTSILNRAKITLNVTRTWYDDNFSRFSMAASNRSLIVSEPMLPHCPQYKPGEHFVSSQIDQLVDTIQHYLNHEAERLRIVENAYHLLTTELRFRDSMARIMAAAVCELQRRRPDSARLAPAIR